METNLSNEVRRLKNLKNYKNKSDSEIEQIARISCWKKQIAVADKFQDNNEKKEAEILLDNYFENYTFENYNQVTLLSTLIYEETLLKRVRDDINAVSADENNKFISDKQIQSLHAIEDRVEQLKLKLGISKVDERKDDLTALEEMQEKFRIYQEFNRNEFEAMIPFVCPKCKTEDVQMYLFRRRVKDFEILRHPFFQGRWLYSPEIYADVKSGKLAKEDAARYLKTSLRMVNWTLDNEYKICSIEGVPQEKVDEFIENNPYLPNVEDLKNDKNSNNSKSNE